MYLVTAQDGEEFKAEGRDDMPKARALAEQWARNGYGQVEVWLRTHGVKAVTSMDWTEYAKGLTGPNL